MKTRNEMAIGAVTSYIDNAAISSEPVLYRPETGSMVFGDILSARTVSTGGKADLDAIFEKAGRIYNLPPNLLKAVAKAESDFRPNATSRVGAMGIMQLMPGTAKYLGVTDPYDPEQNIMGGAKYLRQMLDKYDGDITLALAAYNAGPGTISKNGGAPLQSQLRGYIPRVLGYFYGSDIYAGEVSYNATNSSGATDGAKNSLKYSEAFAQMLLFKIIEMQMSSPDDDKNKVF